MSPSAIPAAGSAVRTRTNAGTGSCRHDEMVMRREYSGTGGPCSSGIMMPAEKQEPKNSSSSQRSRLFLRCPHDASGSAQSLVPFGGGREKVSMSVQSTARAALAVLC